MQSAAEGMRRLLAAAAFVDPVVPVVSNVTTQTITSGSAFAAELADQITSPVLWLDDVRAMLEAGMTDFVEFGPGRVLTGALRRTEPTATLRNIGTAAEARGEASE
jgi:[acyl-carrier-protein] S-malonyltransferase